MPSSQDYFDAEQDLRKASYAEPNNADVAALTKKLKVGQLETTSGRGGGALITAACWVNRPCGSVACLFGSGGPGTSLCGLAPALPTLLLPPPHHPQSPPPPPPRPACREYMAGCSKFKSMLQLLIKQQNKKEASLYSKMFKPSPATSAAAHPANGHHHDDDAAAASGPMDVEAPQATAGADALPQSDQ